MIFATVGTHYQGFERLVKKIDELAGNLNDRIVIQTGYTVYEPLQVVWFRFIDNEDEFNRFFQEADVIVSHAGAGTIIKASSFGKPLVVVPRLRRFGEHIDDQQVELAEALDNAGDAIAVFDIRNLLGAIDRAKAKNHAHEANNTALVGYLKETLAKMTG